MKKVISLLFALIAIGCHRRIIITSTSDDCRLFEVDFDPAVHVEKSPLDSAFTNFVDRTESGAFFTHSYLGQSDFHRAVVLSSESNDVTVTNLLTQQKRSIPDSTQEEIRGLIASMEKGSVRQACFNDASEGSISLFVVKDKGVIIFKYDAQFQDHTHLNENEKEKIANALRLITILANFP